MVSLPAGFRSEDHHDLSPADHPRSWWKETCCARIGEESPDRRAVAERGDWKPGLAGGRSRARGSASDPTGAGCGGPLPGAGRHPYYEGAATESRVLVDDANARVSFGRIRRALRVTGPFVRSSRTHARAAHRRTSTVYEDGSPSPQTFNPSPPQPAPGKTINQAEQGSSTGQRCPGCSPSVIAILVGVITLVSGFSATCRLAQEHWWPAPSRAHVPAPTVRGDRDGHRMPYLRVQPRGGSGSPSSRPSSRDDPGRRSPGRHAPPTSSRQKVAWCSSAAHGRCRGAR